LICQIAEYFNRAIPEVPHSDEDAFIMVGLGPGGGPRALGQG
jgi:hypothetical protein